MELIAEFDREDDGRWICDLHWADNSTVVYGPSQDQALANAVAVALEVIAAELRDGSHGVPASITIRPLP